jgi:decaprenyl-phosphate phosphoribosyltransferase
VAVSMSLAVSLLKLRYHLSFAGVVMGALLFAPHVDAELTGRLVLLYVAFNVLLYGGIYTFNDVADREADAAHPRKCRRPVASGRVPVRTALIGALCLVLAGMLMAAWLFPPEIVLASAGAVAINVAYSCGGRNLPCVDILLNSAPHPVRFLLGVLIVDRTPPAGHLAAWLCLAGGVACVRRLIEQDAPGASARSTLAWYSPAGLIAATNVGFAALIALALLDELASPGFYAIVLSGYLLLVIGGRRPGYGRSFGAWLWLR